MKYLDVFRFIQYLDLFRHLCEQNCNYSSVSKLLCSIPQGSILCPLLILIYLNDLPQAVASNSLLYIDDSCIVFQDESIIEIERKLIEDFSSF